MKTALTLPAAALALSLAHASASAQTAAPPPPPPPPAPAAEATPGDVSGSAAPAEDNSANAAPLPPPAPAGETSGPTIEDRVTTLESKNEGFAESYSATQAIVESLNKLKFGGYVQGRYQWDDKSNYGVDNNNTLRELNRFYVRRGRLKATYAGKNAEMVLQIDAIDNQNRSGGPVANVATVKDAEATFVDTWTPFNLRLTAGKFKVPFSYDLLQSDDLAEMPERVSAIGALFPGDRDTGLRLRGGYNLARGLDFTVTLAYVNGTGDTAPENNSKKDFFARAVFDIDLGFASWVVAGAGQFGQELKNGSSATAGGRPATYYNVDRRRFEADTQLYIDVPAIGGASLRYEYIWANDEPSASGVLPADPCGKQKSAGWYATYVQNVGEHLGGVFRVDAWDPYTSAPTGCVVANIPAGEPALAKAVSNAAKDHVTTLGGGLLIYPSNNFRFSFIYEHPIEQTAAKVANDRFTAQLQARF